MNVTSAELRKTPTTKRTVTPCHRGNLIAIYFSASANNMFTTEWYKVAKPTTRKYFWHTDSVETRDNPVNMLRGSLRRLRRLMMMTVINTLSVNPTKVHSIFATAMKALKLKINWIFPLTSFSQKNTIFVSAVHFSYFFYWFLILWCT